MNLLLQVLLLVSCTAIVVAKYNSEDFTEEGNGLNWFYYFTDYLATPYTIT